MEVLKDLIEAKEAVRRKFYALKRGKSALSYLAEESLKPVTGKLKEISEHAKTTNEVLKTQKQPSFFSPIASTRRKFKHTSSPLSSPPTPSTIKQTSLLQKVLPFSPQQSRSSLSGNQSEDDTDDESAGATGGLSKTAIEYFNQNLTDPGGADYNWGVKITPQGTYTLGSKPIAFLPNDDIIVDGSTYKGTPGLYELLTRKQPDEQVYTDEDLATYKELLERTNAHKKKYRADGPLHYNSTPKYRGVIRGLFKGKGLYKKLRSDVDYVWYRDTDELFKRLQLLIAARQAGNDGLENEIESILQELQEEGIIEKI